MERQKVQNSSFAAWKSTTTVVYETVTFMSSIKLNSMVKLKSSTEEEGGIKSDTISDRFWIHGEMS